MPVPTSPSGVLALARTPGGTRLIRYTLISVISVIISIIVLAVTHGVLHWPAFWANISSVVVATVPSYELNRKWAWGKRGKSHVWKEVVPFWVLAFVGLAFSTLWAVLAENFAKGRHMTHVHQTIVVEIAVIGSYGILWIGKFIIFNKILFAHHPEDLEPALDGRAGLPG
ncbi:MAG TPA: GtrA family protein [Acidimicrobiales bacterium]|nr:GtrA family protein [Acidimicrobiales bacterium]